MLKKYKLYKTQLLFSKNSPSYETAKSDNYSTAHRGGRE
jgi:hypothetical protein